MNTLYSSSILDLNSLTCAAFRSGILHSTVHCWSSRMEICTHAPLRVLMRVLRSEH